MKKRKGFWGRFDDLMDELPEFINKEINNSTTIKQTGRSNVSIIGKGNKVRSYGSNSSTITQDGYSVVVKTKNKEIVITVNGKEVFKETKK